MFSKRSSYLPVVSFFVKSVPRTYDSFVPTVLPSESLTTNVSPFRSSSVTSPFIVFVIKRLPRSGA